MYTDPQVLQIVVSPFWVHDGEVKVTVSRGAMVYIELKHDGQFVTTLRLPINKKGVFEGVKIDQLSQPKLEIASVYQYADYLTRLERIIKFLQTDFTGKTATLV